MGRGSHGDHMPTMHRGDLEGGGTGHPWKVDLTGKGGQTGHINTLTSLDCAAEIGSDTELMASLMAGDLRGRVGSSINRGSPDITVQTWPESGVLVQLLVLANS